ncbi:MAG: aldehyde dehydrogenase family protein, partial [Phycisphaerales bacterium]
MSSEVLIGGAWRGSRSGETFEVRDPADASVVAAVPACGAEEAREAVEAAAAAFPAWRDLTGDRRRALLHRIADAIEARAEEISLVESFDTGQPLRFMS